MGHKRSSIVVTSDSKSTVKCYSVFSSSLTASSGLKRARASWTTSSTETKEGMSRVTARVTLSLSRGRPDLEVPDTMNANPDHTDQVHKAVLLASLHDIDAPPHFLSSPIAAAAAKTSQQLRIVLYSHLFNTDNPQRPSAAVGTRRWDAVQSTLTYVYVQAMKVAQEMGRILMDVDVLLKGEHEPLSETITADAEVIFRSEFSCAHIHRIAFLNQHRQSSTWTG